MRGKARQVSERAGTADVPAPWPARWYAALIVWFRWLVLCGCIVGAGAAYMLLPALSPSTTSRVLSLVPRHSEAVQTEIAALQKFHLPLLSRTLIVVRNPHRLSVVEQAKVVDIALRIDKHQFSGAAKLPGSGEIAGALPVVNTLALFPASHERGTTALLYLYFPANVSVGDQVRQATALAHRYLPASGATFVGVTGITAAQLDQNQVVTDALPWVELGSLLVIAVVVGTKFRCVGAPVAALATAALAFEVATRLIAWASQRYGIAVPGELEPLITVLVAGVATDYSIFFLSAFRDRLREIPDARPAVKQAVAGVMPIVLVAGISVAAGTATLRFANLSLFGQLGPGMAISVAVCALAALIFLPAVLACAGRAVFWPGTRPHPDSPAAAQPRPLRRLRVAFVRSLVRRRTVAVLALVVTIAALGAGALQLSRVSVGTDLLADLPSDSTAAVAAHQAAEGFVPGTVAPTEILLLGRRLNAQRPALAQLQHELSDEPHIAAVVGPADVPLRGGHNVLLTASGSAARYLVLLGQRPYGAEAIGTVRDLKQHLPDLLTRAGLSGVDADLTGDTALSGTITAASNHDLVRVGLLTIAILLLILIVYLRALLTPVLLMAATVLSVAATIGVTTWLFETVAGVPGLTFYVPFAVAVLLLSFGSDYNVFLVGRIWQGATDVPFRRRVIDGSAQAGGAITTAGITLSMSFALLAVVPLGAFREFAFAMVLGVLLDTFVVRSIIVPALLSLLGPAAAWPSRRLRGGPPRPVAEGSAAGYPADYPPT